MDNTRNAKPKRLAATSRVLLALLMALLAATAVYAHLTGPFADFLVSVQDEGTAVKLTEELSRTKEQIEQLVPRVNRMEADYSAKQDSAADKLLLYSEWGADAWLAYLQQADQLVDVLGGQWLLERSLQTYISELDELYRQFLQLLAEKDTLEGHRRLLQMIEENGRARGQFLAQNSEVPLDRLANYLDIDWGTEVEPHLLKSLEHDAVLAAEKLPQWLDASQNFASDSRNLLGEQWLNEMSDLDYFIRSDHIYVLFVKPELHVILIGQMLDDGQGSSSLQFEAGFFNGFLMPTVLMEELHGLKLKYDKLKEAVHVTGSVQVHQTTGSLRIETSP